MKTTRLYPMLLALLAAVLFGASAPLSKLLLQDVQPIPLAALLYLGSGAGAALLRLILSIYQQGNETEAKLARKDWPWLAGAIVAGGVLGPILLMVSLEKTPASTASLLLNFESVATALIAGVVFKEAISRRIWWGLASITLASIILSFSGGWGFSSGAFGVLAACFFWGLDNNLTRNISAKDPLAIVTIKGLGAGAFSLLLGLAFGNAFPGLRSALLALGVGAVCYGISITLFVLALRSLGAARTGALFATAPFVGALLSLMLFRENLGIQFFLSLPFMVFGAVFLMSEDHSHAHPHMGLEHEHCHFHDDLHHFHAHQLVKEGTNGEHSHPHRHDGLTHAHAHTPDLHHWHEHG